MAAAQHSPQAKPFLAIGGTKLRCTKNAGMPGAGRIPGQLQETPKVKADATAHLALTLKLRLSGDVELREEH